MAKLTITVTDPDTIKLLAKYRQFIKDEDGARGTATEAVEGLIIASLDDHERFANWRRRQTAGAASMKNVALHPTAQAAEHALETADTLVPVRRTA
jgi:hypothetical protein